MEPAEWTPRWAWATALKAAAGRSILLGIPAAILTVWVACLETVGLDEYVDFVGIGLGLPAGYLVGRGLVNRSGLPGKTLAVPVAAILAVAELVAAWALLPFLHPTGETWLGVGLLIGFSAAACWFSLGVDQS